MRWLWQVSQHHGPLQTQALPISSEKVYFKIMKEVVVFAKPEMRETQRIVFCGFAVHTKVSQCYVLYFLLGEHQHSHDVQQQSLSLSLCFVC